MRASVALKAQLHHTFNFFMLGIIIKNNVCNDICNLSHFQEILYHKKSKTNIPARGKISESEMKVAVSSVLEGHGVNTVAKKLALTE